MTGTFLTGTIFLTGTTFLEKNAELKNKNKQNAITQDAITYAFEKLIRDFKGIDETVGHDNITVDFDGANPNANLLQRMGRTTFPVIIRNLTKEDISKNVSFQEYKDLVLDEGFDVGIKQTYSNSYYERDAKKSPPTFAAGVLGALTTIFTVASVIPPEDFISKALVTLGVGTPSLVALFVSSTSMSPATCELKFTRKPPLPYKIG